MALYWHLAWVMSPHHGQCLPTLRRRTLTAGMPHCAHRSTCCAQGPKLEMLAILARLLQTS